VTILEGIKSVAGPGIEVAYEAGCPLTLTNNAKANENVWAKALSAVSNADAIIYVGGLSPRLEGEQMKLDIDGFYAGDRTRIELPSVQTEFLKALKATGKPVIFVNCSGSAVAIPWEAANVPAILQAWYPGQEGGRAVANILFGDTNPSGRLPITFYKTTADLPDFEDYSMSNRTYRYFNGKPLFAFGYGLSYTQFSYRNAHLDSASLNRGDTAKVSFEVTNLGKRDGDEIAQIYVRHAHSSVPQARLALCGFARVHVQQNQSTRVTVEIPAERLRYWNTDKKQYAVEAGDYELLIGGASDNIQLKVPLKIADTN
jgi:beta-glucosidase